MHRYAACIFALFLLFSGGAVWGSTDLSPYFQTLRDSVSGFPVSEDQRANLVELLDFAELQSSNPVVQFTTVGELLDAFLLQLATIALAPQSDAPQVDERLFLQQDDNGGPFDELLHAVDMIKGTMFVEGGPLLASPAPSVSPPEGSCSISLLVRTLGPALNDPGGTFYTTFAQTVDLEALAENPGGQYEWTLEPGEDRLTISGGNRFSFRATDRWTFRVTVTYTDPQQRQCQDSVWIRVQGAFPEDD